MTAANIVYRQAHFLMSTPTLANSPPDSGFEIAFAGRSNAGKSSAINAITQQKSLARTSKTPGRTQQLVFFTVSEDRRLVDLPGYGYAHVAQSIKMQWQQTMQDYLSSRRCLQGLCIFMDIRHPLTDLDQTMIEWAAKIDLPLYIALTKADKLKRGAAQAALLKTRRALGYLDRAEVHLFSATHQIGLQEIYGVLDRWLRIEA